MCYEIGLIMVKIRRNSVCPCGSGKKYKKCCVNRLTDREITYKNKIHEWYPHGDIRVTKRDEVKVSEVILEYAGELIDDANTAEGQDAAIVIAITAWNLSLFDKKICKQKLLELPDIIIKPKTHPNIHKKITALLQVMIKKKHREYPTINRLIINHELIRAKHGLHLNVTSTNFSENEIN